MAHEKKGNMMVLFSAVVVVVLACPVAGFLPNHYLLSVPPPEDFTHSEITETGILNAVASFLQPSSASAMHFDTGQDVKNITLQNFIGTYCQASSSCGSQTGLRFAVAQIIRAGNDVDQFQHSHATWHVNGERIREAHKEAVKLLDKILGGLNASNPDYDLARELIGQYLHIVQTFYSNTNWVNLNGGDVYTDFGLPNKILMACASVSIATCASCGQLGGGRSCADNLLPIGPILTSGYRSEQDIAKPNGTVDALNNGKCSHGGTFDSSGQQIPAYGGINKDTSDPGISPHFRLHNTAALASISHTARFLSDSVDGLLTKIGQNKFRNLFLLDAKGTVLVGGNTNDKILQVSEATTASKLSNFLDGISKKCESVTAVSITTALTKASPSTSVYIISGLTNEYMDFNALITKATSRGITLHAVLMTDCAAKRRRRSQDLLSRQRRAGGSADTYKALAVSSGGIVYYTNKQSVTHMTKLFQTFIADSTVDINRATLTNMGANIEIPVDDYLTSLTIQILSNHTTVKYKLYKPDGTEVQFGTGEATLEDLGMGNRMIKIQKPTVGKLRLQNADGNSWDVIVSGQSDVDFSGQLTAQSLDTHFQYDLWGRPIAGHKTSVIVTVWDVDQVASIDTLLLLDEDGVEINRLSLTRGQGRRTDLFKADFTLPKKKFQMAILGRDKSGNLLRRLQSAMVVPLTINLQISDITDALYVNEDLKIPYNVTNVGDTEQWVEVSIKDDMKFVRPPTIKTTKLTKDSSYQGEFKIHAGATPGVTTTLTISARTYTPRNSMSQFQIRRITVEEHLNQTTDNSTPVCNVTSLNGDCAGSKLDPCLCSGYSWIAKANIYDEGFGLYQIFNSTHGKGKFTVDPFPMGYTRVNGTVSATMESDCCLPKAYINVVDLAGNTGQCVIDLTAGVTPQTTCTTTTDSTSVATTTESTTVMTTTESTTPTSTTDTSTTSTSTDSTTTTTSQVTSTRPQASTSISTGSTVLTSCNKLLNTCTTATSSTVTAAPLVTTKVSTSATSLTKKNSGNLNPTTTQTSIVSNTSPSNPTSKISASGLKHTSTSVANNVNTAPAISSVKTTAAPISNKIATTATTTTQSAQPSSINSGISSSNANASPTGSRSNVSPTGYNSNTTPTSDEKDNSVSLVSILGLCFAGVAAVSAVIATGFLLCRFGPCTKSSVSPISSQPPYSTSRAF